MKFTRRQCIVGTATLAASSLPISALMRAATASTSFDAALTDIKRRLIGFHKSIDLTQVEPGGLLTGDMEINGGLRYDDAELITGKGQFGIQPCARVDDVKDKERPGVLPLFEILSVSGKPNDDAKIETLRLLEVLLDVLQFDQSQIAFVSVPQFQDLQTVLDDKGEWRSDAVAIRDPKDARTEGDGSGYFQAPGAETGMYTAGIYYALDPNSAPIQASAQDGWLEIGELVFDETSHFSYSLGLDRIAMALTGEVPRWESREQRLQNLVALEET
ncbi:MAG: hypothetical protein AAF530_07545 [Pseudomonadota bacterium]